MNQFYFGAPTPPRKPASTLRRLLIRCPATSKLVPTGQTVEEPLWAETKQKSGKSACPHCNRVHSWVKKDVLLAR